MKLIINYPKDKTMLEDRIAYIRATLMQKYIEDLNLKKESKEWVINHLKKY